MVGTELQRAEECGKRSTHPHILSQGIPHRGNQWWRIYQRPHLGDVSRIDNKEEVGREAIRQARNDAYPGVDTHKHHCDHHQNHRKERHIHRAIDNLHNATHRLLDILRRILHVDKVGRHSSKHISCPLWVLARSLAVILDILRHTSILRYIALAQRLTIKLRSKESKRHHSKYHDAHNPHKSTLAPRQNIVSSKQTLNLFYHLFSIEIIIGQRYEKFTKK